MSVSKKLTAKHCAGGLNKGTGVLSLKPEENVESRNMEYTIDGACATSLGYDDPGMNWGENGHGIDGLHKVALYPNPIFAAVNGKLKYADFTVAPQSAASVYNVDTGLTLTAGSPVQMKDYRGTIYLVNGTETAKKIAIGQLQNNELAASVTWELNDAEGYRFKNGVGKVYCEGDEADYSGVSGSGAGDDLQNVTNGLAHSAGAYVTQYDDLGAPPTGSLKGSTLAIWRDTIWIAGMPDEPGVLRYGKTISLVGDLVAGDINDFSDGNNYIIGDGGQITALHATEKRLYAFMKDKVHFIDVVYDISGTQVFNVSQLFTGVYGCPNAFCVTEMEDVVLFFTGKRLIRIGYDPNGQTLIPDESFDREIFPLLQDADEDQSRARLTYNPSSKEVRLQYYAGGLAKTIKYHKQQDVYSGFSDEEASCFVVHRRNTYFGDRDDDTVWKIGMSIDSAGTDTLHRYETGRVDGGTKNWKLYTKGRVYGKKNLGSTLAFVTNVDTKKVGMTRTITDDVVDQSADATPLGEAVTGSDEIGLAGDTTNLFPYDYPFLLGRRGKDYSFAISSEESGAIWTVDKWVVEWEEFDSEPRTNY